MTAARAARSSELTVETRRRVQAVAIVAGVGSAVAVLAWSVDNTSFDVWGGILVGAVLLAVGLPMVVTVGRRETEPRIARLLVGALVLKLASGLVRYAVSFSVYDGATDAALYDRVGEALAPFYRSGDFSPDIGELTGTGFVKALTGVVYALTGPTQIGGFLVFSWFGFWGLYLFYRAFVLACPDGDRWRYACLVFLLPSLLFWSSSIGKEAWMTFTLGLVAYGAARLLTKRHGGFTALALGLAGSAMVRPHVSAILAVSLVLAYAVRRRPKGASLADPIGKLVGLAVLGLVLVSLVSQTQELLGVDEFNRDAVVTVLQETQARTTQDGAVVELNNETDLSPAGFPLAIVSVLFRPFPWEAGNLLALLAAVEGIAVLVLFLAGWRRLVGAVRSVLNNAYVVFCLVYGVLFVHGFSSFSNFGILTRQRVQVLPFLIVLLALPAFQGARRDWRGLLVEPPAPGEEERRVPEPVTIR